jgi:hypothetical protein
MADDKLPDLARLEREGAESLALADLYVRTLTRLAHRMHTVTSAGPPQTTVDLRSAALRLTHATNEAMTALVAVIVQSARLETLARMRTTQEPKSTEPPKR